MLSGLYPLAVIRTRVSHFLKPTGLLAFDRRRSHRTLRAALLPALAWCVFGCLPAYAAETAPEPASLGTGTVAFWLVVYSLVVIAASLFGGWIPGRVALTHARIQHIVSFVAGLMLGIALLHLLPHALTIGERIGPDVVAGFVLLGILGMFVLLRAFHFHVHEPDSLVTETADGPSPLTVDHECSSPAHSHHSHDHDHDHGVHGGDGHHGDGDTGLGWTGLFLGLAIHTLVDGVALGAAMTADLSHNKSGLFPGLGILAAIALHKPLDAMSITSLMAVDGWTSQSQKAVNVLFALLCPLGACLFFFGLSFSSSGFVACALGFSAGVFLCIALSDLLPEMEFHTHDKVTLSVALALGIAVAWAIRLAEPGHLHG